MPFHTGVFGNGTIYLTPPADVPNGTRAYVYILSPDEDPVSFYRRLVLLEPEDARLYNQLGLAQIEAGKLVDAEASLNRAVQLDFGFAEAHFNLGRCYARQGQLDSAQHAYRAAVDLAPEEAATHRQLITVLLLMDDLDAALAAVTMALQCVPDLLDWVQHDNALTPLRDDPRWSDALAAAQA
jgi:Flp pilus assembly protein TadD